MEGVQVREHNAPGQPIWAAVRVESGSGLYFQSAHLLSALVVNTVSPGSFLTSL